jgi:predicted tellurium resistance membrane protein TerC
METFLNSESLTALVTLTFMEIVLGIDNIIFISLLVGRLPPEKKEKVRSLGIFFALFIRIGLLFSISWVMGLKDPLFTLFTQVFSGRDLILLGGGLFLIAKSTHEIHNKVELKEEEHEIKGRTSNPYTTFLMILLLDVVFSLDSVITAVGMANQISIMVIAMVISMVVMLYFAKKIGHFVDAHPTIKILALAFLILIGVMLVMEGMGKHIDKGYIYFAMFFSLGVELINMRHRKKKSLNSIKSI